MDEQLYKSRGAKLSCWRHMLSSGKWCRPLQNHYVSLLSTSKMPVIVHPHMHLETSFSFNPFIFFFNLLTCRSSFYITDMALENYFVNIFSHSGACLFTHLVVSSDEKKALFFVYSNLSFYYIYFFNTFYTFSLHLNHEAVLGNFPPAYVYKQCGIDFYV